MHVTIWGSQGASCRISICASRGGGLTALLRIPVLQAALVLCLLAPAVPSQAASTHEEDGYRLWLRDAPVEPAIQQEYAFLNGGIALEGGLSPTTQAAIAELQDGLHAMLGAPVGLRTETAQSAINLRLIGSSDAAGTGRSCNLQPEKKGGFSISYSAGGAPRIDIEAREDIGLLYGSYALLRHIRQGGSPDTIAYCDQPRITHRLLNHWDNPDGSVERGYSGRSIFDWWRLPDHVDQRIVDYARANASIGINGTVLNNVNARAQMLSSDYISKAAALADTLRPYGIRVYLSARFSAPRDIGGLPNADPQDPKVRQWWKDKADEIYRAIPDFGGFLVKANSEGQPGPQDYGRSHVEGANMLAEAIGDRGLIFWRAFVYKAENGGDRVKQAYDEFTPLDGKFAKNVILQVKNGPLDFQPREPFHPLFGAMPKTPLAIELQITKEYLGFSTHLAYLGPLFEEALDADTGVDAAPVPVASIVDGSNDGHRISAIAGVANIGSDRNWTGSHFDQANWYAFGRLAWDPSLSSEAIADEWIAQSFTRELAPRTTIAKLMLDSRQAVVDYMTPLGLAHLMGTGHHYGPAPWVDNLERADWNPYYFHRADRDGIGIDRGVRGSNALSQYAPRAAKRFASRNQNNLPYLLWFHRVGWNEKISTGRTLWEEMVFRYERGQNWVEQAKVTWDGLKATIDPQRHKEISAFLAIQAREARWWRDASLAYWMDRNGLALPTDVRAPAHSLEFYKALAFPDAPGN